MDGRSAGWPRSSLQWGNRMRHMRPLCSHCIYWVTDRPSGQATVGHCHRFPPTVMLHPENATILQKFPATDHHQWCGEWSDDDSKLVAAARGLVMKSAQNV